MIDLPEEWAASLANQPETGMGYQVVSVVLADGRKIDRVVVVEGRITQIYGFKSIPFSSDQIAQVVVTHDKWDFNADRGGKP